MLNIVQSAVALAGAVAVASAQARPQQHLRSLQPCLTGTISVDLQQLPPNFAGYDIESLVRKLTASGGAKAKSEFETTEAFQARLKLEVGPGLLPFVLPVGEDDGDAVAFKYDADSKAMTANIWGVLPWILHTAEAEKHPPLQVAIKRRLLSSRRYAATNSFGAKALVDSKEYNEYGLAFAKGIISSESPKYSRMFLNEC